jgi:hypothetical protein
MTLAGAALGRGGDAEIGLTDEALPVRTEGGRRRSPDHRRFILAGLAKDRFEVLGALAHTSWAALTRRTGRPSSKATASAASVFPVSGRPWKRAVVPMPRSNAPTAPSAGLHL